MTVIAAFNTPCDGAHGVRGSLNMATEIDTHWMDRVRLAAAGRSFTGSRRDEPHALTAARVSLRARTGVTQETLYENARQRRMESNGGSRSARASTAAALIALGTLASI